jgi:hypothetical protein
MIVKYSDYNNSHQVIQHNYQQEWNEINSILRSMPLYLKASEQANKIGSPIFDPVGINDHIKVELKKYRWLTNIAIPQGYEFLGTDIDSGKKGIIVEAQFSNYPFLLNNVIRSELFYKSKLSLTTQPTALVIIITKAHMFPASNSTLYFEQAQKQLSSLLKYNIFDAPIRLVGLFENQDSQIGIVWTEYTNRYSRKIAQRSNKQCIINSPTSTRGRCKIDII